MPSRPLGKSRTELTPLAGLAGGAGRRRAGQEPRPCRLCDAWVACCVARGAARPCACAAGLVYGGAGPCMSRAACNFRPAGLPCPPTSPSCPLGRRRPRPWTRTLCEPPQRPATGLPTRPLSRPTAAAVPPGHGLAAGWLQPAVPAAPRLSPPRSFMSQGRRPVPPHFGLALAARQLHRALVISSPANPL